MPIGFGKALEIRKDPNADRGKWAEKPINRVKKMFTDPVGSIEDVAYAAGLPREGQEVTPDDIAGILMNFGGMGAIRSMGSVPKTGVQAFSSETAVAPKRPSSEVANLVKQFEEKLGKPFKQWSREELFEFQKMRPAPKPVEAPVEPQPTPIPEEEVVEQAIGRSPLERVVNPPRAKKIKPVQAAAEQPAEMGLEGPPQSAASEITMPKPRTPEDVKSEAFARYEKRSGKTRDAWDPNDLDRARQLVAEQQKMEAFGAEIGKRPLDWGPQEIYQYQRSQYGGRE